MWLVVVAGGRGARFGRPKQFEPLAGRTVLERSVEAGRTVADGVVVVVPAGSAGEAAPSRAGDRWVTGGTTRSASVRAGLAAVPLDAEVVVVHDAARPLASPELFEAVVAAVRRGAEGAVAALPVLDTIKRMNDGVVVDTLDRSSLVAVQTPQAFSAAALRRAHGSGAEATDDAALVEAEGGRVVAVPGEASNLKITTPQDLVVAEVLLSSGLTRSAAAEAGS